MPLAPCTAHRTRLDRAIVASVAAMLALNVVVLSSQVHATPVSPALTAHAPHTVAIA